MNLLWVLTCIAMVTASVDAQRTLNFSKPITSLERRPRPMTWARPPEERRKLSIFPKNNLKFVVTPKVAVKSEESTTIGLPTKRPLMRRFTVHDKNERGSWRFAPREPLMETKRFTVTMAPPRLVKENSRYSLKSNDEIFEESKKIKTVINGSNTRQQLNKLQINKGNLIDVLGNKNFNIITPKRFSQVNKINEQETGNIQTNIEFKNDFTNESLSDVVPKTKIVESDKESRKNSMPSNIEDILSETIEARSLFLNDMSLVDRYENNDLINKEKSKLNKDGITNLKGLELLMENILNGTVTNHSPALNSDNDEPVIIENYITNKMDDGRSQKLYIETKKAHQVKLINEKQNPIENTANTSEQTMGTLHAEPLILDQIQNISNEKQNIDINNIKKNIHEPIISTIELDISTDDHVASIPDLRDGPQSKSLFGHFRNWGIESIFDTTIVNDAKIEDSLPAEFIPESDKRVLNELLDEQYNNTEILKDVVIHDIFSMTGDPNELFVNRSDIDASENNSNESLNNLTTLSYNYTRQEYSNESLLIGEELSNESVNDKYKKITEASLNKSSQDKSNSYTDEVSNESAIENINNFTGEVSNESNYSVNNNSNSLTEEISKESQTEPIKYSDKGSNESNTTGEDRSNEETSNESIIDKPNYTAEVSNETAIHKKDDLSEERDSNESNMAVEEISIESGENSENLTEDSVESESIIDISLATEDISVEALIDEANNFTDGDISQEPKLSSEGNIPRRFIRSNNIIEEENPPTIVSGFKYTGHEVRLSQDLSFKNINA